MERSQNRSHRKAAAEPILVCLGDVQYCDCTAGGPRLRSRRNRKETPTLGGGGGGGISYKVSLSWRTNCRRTVMTALVIWQIRVTAGPEDKQNMKTRLSLLRQWFTNSCLLGHVALYTISYISQTAVLLLHSSFFLLFFFFCTFLFLLSLWVFLSAHWCSACSLCHLSASPLGWLSTHRCFQQVKKYC